MSTSELPAIRLRARSGIPIEQRLRALTPSSADTWALTGVILVAALIRILVIDNQSIWTDEALTTYEAGLPLGAMLHTIAGVETTPPLFFVLTWGWAKVFGTGAVALRAVSTLAGVALVPIAYASARRLFSRWAGVLAAALVALNPFLIWYSQEARAYMLLAFLSGASFLCFLRALEDPSRRRVAWWAGVSALALATHFFAGFGVAPEALWLLWRHRQRIVWAAVAAVALMQLAMLPFAVTDTAHGTGWIAVTPLVHRVTDLMREWAMSVYARRFNTLQMLAGWLVVAGLVTGMILFSGERRVRRGAWVAGTVGAFVVLAPLVLVLVGQDYFLSRNLIPGLLPLLVLVAGACTAPRVRVPGAVLAAGLLAMFAFSTLLVQTKDRYQRPNWRALAHVLGAAPAPRAVLVAGGLGADPLKLYLPGVHWVQPQLHRVLISEIDVVGAQKKMLLAPPPGSGRRPMHNAAGIGRPEPVLQAPQGTRLLARFRELNWTVDRVQLSRPRRLDVRQLLVMAHHLFLRTPQLLLVFFQRPER